MIDVFPVVVPYFSVASAAAVVTVVHILTEDKGPILSPCTTENVTTK